jgi:PKD domain
MRRWGSRDDSASTGDAHTTTLARRRAARLAPALLVLLAFVLQAAFAQNASALSGAPCLQTGLETAATDEPSYPAGSTVHVTGTGYSLGCDVVVQVTRPDSVVDAETVTTDLAGSFAYDYVIPGPPYATGTYLVDVLGDGAVLAHTSFEDAAQVNQLFANGPPATGLQTFVFTVGDTIYSNGRIDSGMNGRIVITDGNGVNRFTSPCLPEATFEFGAGNPNGPPQYTFQSSDPVSTDNAHQWSYTVQQFATADTTCAGATQGTASQNFSFAKASLYQDPVLAITKTNFAAGQTAYVRVDGFEVSSSRVSSTWLLPSGATACSNTGGNDRPDSSAGGILPDPVVSSAPAPSTDALHYPPRLQNPGADDPWNYRQSYDGFDPVTNPTPCPAFASANQGTWKLRLQGNATHVTTLSVFVVDTTPPTATIDQASGQADPTTGSSIHFRAVFSEAVTGFTGSDVSFAGSTSGGTKIATVTQIAPNNGTTYDVSVTGMSSRGTVVATIPAASASDAAGNTSTASTSTDNSVTWDRVPATTAPVLSPATPQTNDNLTASTTTSDPDGDNVSVSWVWKVDRGGNVCVVQTNTSASAPAGVRSVSLDFSQNYAPSSCTGPMINPLNPSKGDVVRAEATPNDGLFDGSTASNTVTIANTAPTVTLSAGNDLSVAEGSTHTYGYSISDPDGDSIPSVATNCGASGTKSNDSHTDTSGSFDCTFPDGPASSTVSVQATDSGSGAAAGNTDSQSVTVNNVAPTVTLSAGNDLSVAEGSTHTFSYSISDPGVDTVDSVTTSCSGTGSKVALSDSFTNTSGSFQCAFADGPNSSTVSAAATDSDGDTGAAGTQSVTVNNVAPAVTLSAGNDLSVNEGSTHTYSYSISDPGQDTVTSVTTSCSGTGSKVSGSDSFTNTSGSFQCAFADGPNSSTVSAAATDSDGDTGAAGTQSVTVNNVAPTVTLTGPPSVDEGSTHTYTFSVVDPGVDTFSVATGYPQCGTGGNYVAGSLTTNTTGGSFQCTFPDGPATTELRIKVVDSDGASDTDSEAVQIVEVGNVNPVVTAPANQSSDEGDAHSFALGSFSDPGPDGPWSVSVDWGDGSSATTFTSAAAGSLGSSVHTYADGPATHTVNVTVTDANGGSGSASFQVGVDNVAPTVTLDSGNDLSVAEGSTHSYSYTISDPGADTVSSVTTSCGASGTKSNDTNTDTSGSFDCTFADGPNSSIVSAAATDSDGATGNADTQTVTIDNVAPGTPSLVSPADGAATNDDTPNFDWTDASDDGDDIVTYSLQVDNDGCGFPSPEIDVSGLSASEHTPVAPLAEGTYCWRVRATDSDAANGSYSTTRTLRIDLGRPSVAIDQASGQSDPTPSSPIHFTAVFSEPVSGFTGSDVTIGGTAGGTKTVVVTDSGDQMTFDVAVSGMTDGTVVASIGANGAQDGAGNGNTASTSTDNSVLYDGTAPTLTVNQAADQSDPTSSSPIRFTAVFSEPITGFQNGDVTIGGTAGGSKSASVTNPSSDGRTYEIAISGMTTSGTVIVSVGANKAEDTAGNGNTASTSTDNTVTWVEQTQNTAPVVTITSPPFGSLYAKGSANVNLSASFTDPDSGQTHTCSINWDDGSVTTPAVNESTRTCSQAHTFTNAGVYTIIVTICDNAGGCGTAETWVVVYDPTAGFVTGGGWLNIAAGSYPADPTLSGRANFGFNAKYQNGNGRPPSGQTEFNFQVANFNFHSELYQWLVVSSFKAQFKGTGSVNGVPGYDFRVTAYDGQISGGGGVDKYRIKITRNGQTIFDNRMGQPEDIDGANPQAIAGGSIVIHRP